MRSKTRDSQEKKTVVVLGVARSGTSVTAGILKIIGVDMGPDVITGSWNPRGDFEDQEFAKLSREILSSIGINYYKSLPTPEKVKEILKKRGEFEDKIKRLILEKSNNKSIWGWKLPATPLIIELFLPYLINPHFVVVFRNPLKTANSLVRHAKIDFFHSLRLINFYQRKIVDFLEKYPNLPRIYIAFEDIITDPIREAKRLADFLDLELTESEIEKINNFVVPENKRGVEKKKTALKFMLRSRIPRFYKKCIQNPSKIPIYIYLAFKNNLKLLR